MCGRLDNDCLPARRLAPGPLLALLLLTGCGGAGSTAAPTAPADPGDPGTVLFHDRFEDAGASAGRWTPSQADFDVDETTGTLPLAEGDVITNAPPFERDEGELEFAVAMAWPAWCPTTGPHTSRPIQLVELDSGAVVASLVVTTSADCTTLLAEYRVDPTGTITPSSVLNPITEAPETFADGFHLYRIVLLDDGRATWYRDGIAMIASFVPLSDRGYALRLEGLDIEGAPPVLFDDVEVVQR